MANETEPRDDGVAAESVARDETALGERPASDPAAPDAAPLAPRLDRTTPRPDVLFPDLTISDTDTIHGGGSRSW